jgi:hypothetical protein
MAFNKMLTWLSKNMTKVSVCTVLLFLLVLYFLLNHYNDSKGMLRDSMTTNRAGHDVPTASKVKDSVSRTDLTSNNGYAKVKGVETSTHGLPPSCNSDNSVNPQELLPKDTNSEWAKLNPTGTGDLNDVNMLKAGAHIGINTVGQSLRNANQQLRSDPPVPQLNVGPWNNTTIEPDTSRVPFEIGA